MPTVQITNEKKYVRALSLLHEVGGMYWTKPTRQLVISPFQIRVLKDAGVLPKSNGARKRAKKKP